MTDPVAVLYSDRERHTLLEGIVRTAFGSFLVTAAILATACGTSSPASPSAAILRGGDSHRGGGSDDHGGTPIPTTQELEIHGIVTAVGTNSVTVGTQVVSVNAATKISADDMALTLADIKIGDRVEVKAVMSGTTTTATRIHVEREDDDRGDDR